MTFPLTLIFIWLVFWRPQEWLLPWMYGVPVLSGVVYAALLGLIMEASQKSITMPKTPAVKLAVGLWFAAIMSHVAHTYFQGAINTIVPTFKISLLLVLLLVVINQINRARLVVLIFVMAAVVMSVHAILQYNTGVGFAGSGPIVWWNSDKHKLIIQTLFFGIFSDPNDMGQFLGLAIPFVFAFPRRMNPITFLMAAGVVWFVAEALLTTHSRGTLVGVFAMLACMLLLRFPVKWMPYLAAIGLVAGLGFCAVFGSSLLDMSARDRIVFWGYANRYFKSSPINMLFGGGYGMFAEITGTDRAAHNAFVCCYAELGLIGYWFWFNLLSLGVIGCWRTRAVFKRPRNGAQSYLKRLSGLSIVAMAGFAASSYFLSRAYVYPFFFLFGLMNAIPVIAQRYLPEDYPPLINFRKDVMVTGTLATLGSIAYIYASVLVLNRAYGG
ncbi:MAG: hypothetical protein WCI03_01220 [bacterium]